MYWGNKNNNILSHHNKNNTKMRMILYGCITRPETVIIAMSISNTFEKYEAREET